MSSGRHDARRAHPGRRGRHEPSGPTSPATSAEADGFESMWVGEHPALPASSHTEYPGRSEGLAAPSAAPLPDPLEWLAFAARTTVLGTAVLILPLHRPVILAKRVTRRDQVSGGRVRLGVGVGWTAQEYAACGVSSSTGGPRANELIDALRTLWQEETPTFAGPTVSFKPVHSSPKPSTGPSRSTSAPPAPPAPRGPVNAVTAISRSSATTGSSLGSSAR
ncbi:MAG: LLM class flavin-dependent oxidoreductase [Acidimicrobiales bacterium]